MLDETNPHPADPTATDMLTARIRKAVVQAASAWLRRPDSFDNLLRLKNAVDYLYHATVKQPPE